MKEKESRNGAFLRSRILPFTNSSKIGVFRRFAIYTKSLTQSIRGHAAGALKKYGNQAIGVSRGGKTTKIHALVTENFQLIGLLLTGGQIHDSECATELLSRVKLDGKTVLGDKAFCSSHIRDFIQTQGGTVCIPDKANSRTLHDFDRELYKARNVVERFFLRIKNYRHIATRYDKLTICFLNFVLLSAIMLQL